MFSGARTSILINPHHNSLGAMLWDIFNAIKPSSVQLENSLDVQDLSVITGNDLSVITGNDFSGVTVTALNRLRDV